MPSVIRFLYPYNITPLEANKVKGTSTDYGNFVICLELHYTSSVIWSGALYFLRNT